MQRLNEASAIEYSKSKHKHMLKTMERKFYCYATACKYAVFDDFILNQVVQ